MQPKLPPPPPPLPTKDLKRRGPPITEDSELQLHALAEPVRVKSATWKAWHGTLGKKKWPLPFLVSKADKPGRNDVGNIILAHEFLDDPITLDHKIDLMVELIKKSQCLTAYTGAGLSRSSGIPDYASKRNNTSIVGTTDKIKDVMEAEPTYAHCVLTALQRQGYLKHYVQQNHDGLPQKSGFPQELINEIHGAWFDPSNPVINFGGNLREDLFEWMLEIQEKTDLCLCLGSSLSGMSADKTAEEPMRRSARGKALGTIIVNLQQTRIDCESSLRIWAKLDDVFAMVAQRMQLGDVRPLPFVIPDCGDIFSLPYSKTGAKTTNGKLHVLDLRIGSEVKIAVPTARNFGVVGFVDGKNTQGHYVITLKENLFSFKRVLGVWWLEAALRGAIPHLPVVNTYNWHKEHKKKDIS